MNEKSAWCFIGIRLHVWYIWELGDGPLKSPKKPELNKTVQKANNITFLQHSYSLDTRVYSWNKKLVFFFFCPLKCGKLFITSSSTNRHRKSLRKSYVTVLTRMMWQTFFPSLISLMTSEFDFQNPYKGRRVDSTVVLFPQPTDITILKTGIVFAQHLWGSQFLGIILQQTSKAKKRRNTTVTLGICVDIVLAFQARKLNNILVNFNSVMTILTRNH